MDNVYVLGYGGIAVLIICLISFEIRDTRLGHGASRDMGYEYYTADNRCVRIQKAFGSNYKIYVDPSDCPVPTKHNKSGDYFTVRARSAFEAENMIDAIYRRGGVN